MNKLGRTAVVVGLLAIGAAGACYVIAGGSGPTTVQKADKLATAPPPATTPRAASLPRLVDLGAGKCIPCIKMAPILEELKKEYAGRLEVEFIDVWVNPDAGKPYGIKLIPTQIFLDPSGKELWRHEGYISRYGILDKWRELKYEFAEKAVAPTLVRWEPAKADGRAKGSICYMCDGDIAANTRVTVKTEKGEVGLCSPHCYFIMYSCLTQDKTGFEKNVSATDLSTGKPVPATDAIYLYGLDEKTGRHVIKAFADRDSALKERQNAGGSLITWPTLQANELTWRCGFCDRAAYPEDSALVKADGLYTWGCCSHCAMGVAARTQKDLEVHEKDRLTGEPVIVKTLGGYVASVEPATAVAWFGMKKNAEGKWGSAGCFHQGFFANEANLKKWIDQHPSETGRMISIDQALGDKMNLSPQQISNACKIGECAPKK
jgi:thioredoxin 1